MTLSFLKGFVMGKELAKNMSGVGAAAGSGILSVAATGVPGLSAVGISTGLATLGIGSMAVGIGAVAIIGAGTFFGVKKLLDVVFG